MALFGSRKGCKWWQEVELAKRAERRAELKHRTNPTKANYDAWLAAIAGRKQIEATYYD